MKSVSEASTWLRRKPPSETLCAAQLEISRSELKRVEEELRQSEDKFSKVFTNTPDPIVLSSLLEGIIIDVNESFTGLTGYAREEVIGRSSAQIGLWVKEEDRSRIVQMLSQRGYARNVEVSFRIKSGQVRLCLTSAEKIEIGQRPCIISVIRDITEQRAIEDKLKESEERHRLLTENVADVIWTVNVENPNCLTYITPSITRLLGYSVEEAKTRTMAEVFTPHSYEVTMTALSRALEKARGTPEELSRPRTLELELIHKNGSIVPVELSCSFISSPERRPVEILVIARDISERKRAEEEHRFSTERLVRAMEDMIQAMARIVEMRDPFTAGHQRRVAKLACEIAREIGMPKDRIGGLRLASLIHDIGKVRVPAEILTLPDELSEAEFSILKTHPIIGYEITKNIDLPWPIAQTIYQHHERMNGAGYPSGIRGEHIILEARVLAVADVVEAISSHRPYRPALGIDKALAEVAEGKEQLFDPNVVDACITLFRERGFSFE